VKAGWRCGGVPGGILRPAVRQDQAGLSYFKRIVKKMLCVPKGLTLPDPACCIPAAALHGIPTATTRLHRRLPAFCPVTLREEIHEWFCLLDLLQLQPGEAHLCPVLIPAFSEFATVLDLS
jgi:hypothetical protein